MTAPDTLRAVADHLQQAVRLLDAEFMALPIEIQRRISEDDSLSVLDAAVCKRLAAMAEAIERRVA